MKNLVKLVNNHVLFVEGAEDRITAANILAESDNPIARMFNGSGTLALQTTPTSVLDVPYRQVRLTDTHVSVKNMSLMDGGRVIQGVGIGLPDDAKRLYAAWEAATEGRTYNWVTFLADYTKDLEKVGSLMFDHVDTARTEGMMAQVITHPLVGEDEVGLNVETMRKLHKSLQDTHEELEEHTTLEGMWVLLQRHPVVSKTGGRWVKLVLLKGAASGKLLVNAKAWKEMHDGDEDGDGGYISIGETAMFTTEMTNEEMVLPKLVAMDRDDIPEVKVSEPVPTVMGFLARELTGPQHTLFHGLARATAVRASLDGKSAADTDTRFHRAYCRVFDIYHPLAEGTFDVRKGDNGIAAFRDIVKENENHLKGGRVNETVFFPLLSEAQQTDFSKVMQMLGNSANIARGTVFGRLLMTGDENRPRVFGTIVDALVAAGVEPENMIAALQADAMGEEIIPMLMPEQKKPAPKTARREVRLCVGEANSMKEVFECLTLDGKSVLEVKGMHVNEDGTTEVRLQLRAYWKSMSNHPEFKVLVPRIEKVMGTENSKHRLLSLPAMSTRMFCPIFKLQGDQVVEIGIKTWFSLVIKKAIEALATRKKRLTSELVQEHMDRQLRKAVRDLVTIEQDTEGNTTPEGVRERLIRMSEWRVEVDEEETISGRWNRLEVILTKLADLGYDICTTSKNKPGTIVTKTWKQGIPRFLWAVNPFAADLDMKRRVEIREMRKALELANPIAPTLKTKGCAIPAALLDCLTTLNVAVVDLEGWNTWRGEDEKPWGFDTLLVTESGVNKLALKKLCFHAQDKEEASRIEAKLVGEGFAKEDIKVEEVPQDMGGGLFTITYDIVALGPVTDIGKVKAAVGPIKGVMNPAPFQMFSTDTEGNKTEIDIIVPHTTIVKKNAMDAVKYMTAANAGLTEINPDDEPLLEVVKQHVMAVLEDGTEVDLGMRITGPLPFYRPVQTGRSTFDLRLGSHGVKTIYHTMIMARRMEGEEIADRVTFAGTPNWVSQDFARIVEARARVKTEMVALMDETSIEEEFDYALA